MTQDRVIQAARQPGSQARPPVQAYTCVQAGACSQARYALGAQGETRFTLGAAEPARVGRFNPS
jgi:hypothetical protein